jgi:lipoate-protein ligase A
VHLLRGGLDADEALEISVAHALLRRASRGDAGAVLRVRRPRERTVAFGRRDTLLPGYSAAARAAREAGFVPVIRPQGGRAVAYTEQALVVDHVSPHAGFPTGMAFDAASVGSVRKEAPDLSLAELGKAVIAAYDARFGLVESALDDAVVAEAREMADDHRVA